jgi:hypothetical protein
MKKDDIIKDEDLKIEKLYKRGEPTIVKFTYLPTGFTISYSTISCKLSEMRRKAILEIKNELEKLEGNHPVEFQNT